MEMRVRNIMIRVGMIMGISTSLGISSGMYVSLSLNDIEMQLETDEIGETKSTDFSGDF
jgi:hypothetical protein